eukprot:SAG31_NODE_1696_length_7503_cov_45.737574_6_plen_115_part_00
MHVVRILVRTEKPTPVNVIRAAAAAADSNGHHMVARLLRLFSEQTTRVTNRNSFLLARRHARQNNSKPIKQEIKQQIGALPKRAPKFNRTAIQQGMQNQHEGDTAAVGDGVSPW